MSGVTCPPLTWLLWLVEWQAFAWPSLGQGSIPRGRGQGNFIWTAQIRDDRGWFLKEDQCAVISKGDWMLTRKTLWMSTIHFQHYSSVHISLSVILKIFPQKVSTRRSSRTFPSESFPQKVPLRRFLQVRFFFFQKVAYRRSPSQVSLRRFSLESSSWKLPLQFLQKFPLVVSIRSFPKMFPLKGSL